MSEAYDYEDFKAFADAPIFNGLSLNEIWSDIELLSIDGCEPEERIFKVKKKNKHHTETTKSFRCGVFYVKV